MTGLVDVATLHLRQVASPVHPYVLKEIVPIRVCVGYRDPEG
jgi:hypothetical protein